MVKSKHSVLFRVIKSCYCERKIYLTSGRHQIFRLYELGQKRKCSNKAKQIRYITNKVLDEINQNVQSSSIDTSLNFLVKSSSSTERSFGALTMSVRGVTGYSNDGRMKDDLFLILLNTGWLSSWLADGLMKVSLSRHKDAKSCR